MESKHDRTGFHFYRTKRIVILLLFLTALAAHALVQTAGLFPVFRASVSADASYLPSKYETKARTPVLNQKNDPLCWAYSATDMLNISAVMQGLAGQGTALYSAPAFARGIYTGDEYRIVRKQM